LLQATRLCCLRIPIFIRGPRRKFGKLRDFACVLE
jgi:hypothetical protein